jgi:hypothetical protein
VRGDLDAVVAVVVVAHLCATAVLMIVFVVVVAAAILDPGDGRRMQLTNIAPFAMLNSGCWSMGAPVNQLGNEFEAP